MALPPRLRMYALAARRRARLVLGLDADPYPQPPAGAELSPSIAHGRAVGAARPAISWRYDGGDFSAWQSRARAKLIALTGFPARRAAPKSREPADFLLCGGMRRRRVYLELWDGTSAPVDVVWQADAQGALPAVICLQGTNSGSHLSWGEARLPPDPVKIAAGADYARQAARLGFAAFCLEQSCFGERRERALSPVSASATIDAANHALLLGRTLIGERAGDVASVVDWIASGAAGQALSLELDTARVHAMGNSAGGAVALYAAAMDTRIAGVLASGCIGYVRDTIARRRDDSGQNVVPGMLNWLETDDVLSLVAPRPLLAVSGTRDHIFPASGMERVVASARDAYQAAEAGLALAALSPEGPHGFYPALSWAAFAALLEGRSMVGAGTQS
ncbi:MAG: hypothetical protein ACKVSF_02120 [Alphaproteobacteria bacterium]